jgi:hypothetical protein
MERYQLPLRHLQERGSLRETLRVRGLDHSEKLNRLHSIVERSIAAAKEKELHSENFGKVFEQMEKDQEWKTGFYTGEKETVEKALKEHLHIKDEDTA